MENILVERAKMPTREGNASKMVFSIQGVKSGRVLLVGP
jgi:hypothetical protein